MASTEKQSTQPGTAKARPPRIVCLIVLPRLITPIKNGTVIAQVSQKAL